VASPKLLKKVANLGQSGLGTQTANQAKFIPPITSLRATQAIFFGKISQGVQPDFKILSVSIFPC